MTPGQRALRDELRTYFARLIAEAPVERGDWHGPAYRRLVRRMGTDGWLGLGWPVEYGGRGASPIEQLIFYDEAQRAGIPVPLVTLNTIGPTLMRYGTAEQKARFLPGIIRGELHFAVGYTEPEAGTDLASLRTRAVLDGDDYVVNGSKVFTSGGDEADFIWLAVRTDPDAGKHEGISILIVNTTSPGFSATPIRTIAGYTTTATYYSDVRVPAGMLVGAPNEGWRIITTQLNHERVALAAAGPVERALGEVLAWARGARAADGSRAIDVGWVRLNLARVAAKLEALKLLNWRLAWELERERLEPADASAVKVYGTELYVEAYRLLLEVLCAAGTIQAGSPGAVAGGRLEQLYRGAGILTFGGGPNEVQREVIATAGLGMPRSRR